MKRPMSWREYLETERRFQLSGDLTPDQMAESEQFCRELESASAEEIAAYDHFLTHMPDEDADLALVVLKGHLLVEQRVREFVWERMQRPDALEPARLETHQLICLAEALCLPNDAPQWLWETARKLNKIRNDLAHGLAPIGVQDRVQAFVSRYHEMYPIGSGFVGCISHLYAQLAELARLARSKPFKVR